MRALHLAEELAAAERNRRRIVLQAEQQRADLEEEVADLQSLVASLLAADPRLNRQPEVWTGARAAGGQKAKVWSSDTASLPVWAGARAVAAGHMALHPPSAESVAPVSFSRSLRFADDSSRLATENQHLRRQVKALQAQGTDLREEKKQLIEELARAERDRRQLCLLEEQARSDLDRVLPERQGMLASVRMPLFSASARACQEDSETVQQPHEQTRTCEIEMQSQQHLDAKTYFGTKQYEDRAGLSPEVLDISAHSAIKRVLCERCFSEVTIHESKFRSDLASSSDAASRRDAAVGIEPMDSLVQHDPKPQHQGSFRHSETVALGGERIEAAGQGLRRHLEEDISPKKVSIHDSNTVVPSCSSLEPRSSQCSLPRFPGSGLQTHTTEVVEQGDCMSFSSRRLSAHAGANASSRAQIASALITNGKEVTEEEPPVCMRDIAEQKSDYGRKLDSTKVLSEPVEGDVDCGFQCPSLTSPCKTFFSNCNSPDSPQCRNAESLAPRRLYSSGSKSDAFSLARCEVARSSTGSYKVPVSCLEVPKVRPLHLIMAERALQSQGGDLRAAPVRHLRFPLDTVADEHRRAQLAARRVACSYIRCLLNTPVLRTAHLIGTQNQPAGCNLGAQWIAAFYVQSMVPMLLAMPLKLADQGRRTSIEENRYADRSPADICSDRNVGSVTAADVSRTSQTRLTLDIDEETESSDDEIPLVTANRPRHTMHAGMGRASFSEIRPTQRTRRSEQAFLSPRNIAAEWQDHTTGMHSLGFADWSALMAQRTLVGLSPQDIASQRPLSLASMRSPKAGTHKSLSDGLSTPRNQQQEKSLVEGFFIVVDPANEQDEVAERCGPSVRMCWPGDLKGSLLESTVVGGGFCPDPVRFKEAYLNEPFVFSLLETTLDPDGDPSTLVYGCVCGEDPHASVDLASIRSTDTSEAQREGSGQAMSQDDGNSAPNANPCGVMCLLSKWPIFSLLFEILSLLRRNTGRVEEILERCNRVGVHDRLVSQGIDLTDFDWSTPHLRLQLPRPILCGWEVLSSTRSASSQDSSSHTLARWQSAWALQVLLSRWENLVGDTLARLLACVLLEQKVVLLSDDVACISTMALLLRALLWPFRWLHLFLSAPPPADLIRTTPLLDAPSPLIIALTDLPKEWNFSSPYALPSEVVAGLLKHDHVLVSPAWETSGGLKGTSIKLPAGRHIACLKQVAQVKQKLRKCEFDGSKAVQAVQELFEAEVKRLADLIVAYASDQVVGAKKARAALEATDPDITREAQCTLDEVIRQAVKLETFHAWLASQSFLDPKHKETVSFYMSFFQTQLCLDFLSEEISTQLLGEVTGVEKGDARHA